jgi:hypothetical protein
MEGECGSTRHRPSRHSLVAQLARIEERLREILAAEVFLQLVGGNDSDGYRFELTDGATKVTRVVK